MPRSSLPRVLIPGLLLAGCSALAGCHRQQQAAAPAPPPPPSVTVAKPVQHEVMEWDTYTGWLGAVETVDVRARVGGFIVSAPIAEGAIVKKGDVLFEIDARPFQAELDSRLAEQARAEAQVAISEIEYNRVKKLLTESAAAPIEFQTTEATLKQNQATVAAAKAAVESARLNVEWCRVTAPIDGRVSWRYVTTGNLITGGSGQGTLLTTIASIDPIYCYMDVDEQSVLKYQQLARERKRVSSRETRTVCYMQLDNETNYPHEGYIDFIDNRMSSGSGTMRVRCVFANPQGWLTPGFFARVRVPGSGRYSTWLIPDLAISTDQNQKLVFVVNAENTVESRQVKPGALFGSLRSIEGLKPDDRVIITGLARARPGTKVSPHEEPLHFDVAQLTLPTSAPARDASNEQAAGEPAATTAPAASGDSTAPLTARRAP